MKPDPVDWSEAHRLGEEISSSIFRLGMLMAKHDMLMRKLLPEQYAEFDKRRMEELSIENLPKEST
jgi:hypothetical protein